MPDVLSKLFDLADATGAKMASATAETRDDAKIGLALDVGLAMKDLLIRSGESAKRHLKL